MELIDKAEVLAAIENAAKSNPLYVTIAEKDAFKDGVNDALESVLKLEVKAKIEESEPTHFAISEVSTELQKEVDRVWDETSDNFLADGWKEFENIARHFASWGARKENNLFMEQSIETTMQYDEYGDLVPTFADHSNRFKEGEKVKIIVIRK